MQPASVNGEYTRVAVAGLLQTRPEHKCVPGLFPQRFVGYSLL